MWRDAIFLALIARLEDACKLTGELRTRIDQVTRPSKTPASNWQKSSRQEKPKR
jgi:hypothetical protein